MTSYRSSKPGTSLFGASNKEEDGAGRSEGLGDLGEEVRDVKE